MTKYEARGIEDLNIHPDELTEDLFYYEMAQRGFIPKEHAEKAIKRIESEWDEIPVTYMRMAVQMVKNVERYGVACIDWCKG